MAELRGGLIGCGFFAGNHLNAWAEIDGVRIVSLCDRRQEARERYAEQFGIEATYEDAGDMLSRESLDFVDVVTTPETHRQLVELVAQHEVDVICQKPLAESLEDARAMVDACKRAGVRLTVHENFRFQRPMQVVKEASAQVGELFFGRVSFRSGFDIFSRQPYLAVDPRFIIKDLGIHTLDLARFFFGDMSRLYCQTRRVNEKIRGEDVATILLESEGGATCIVDVSYGSRPVEEYFPQTLVELEGREGAVKLGGNYELTVRCGDVVSTQKVAPEVRPWMDPRTSVVQESVIRMQEHCVDCLRDGRDADTCGADNLKTLELVYGAYESADRKAVFEPGRES